MGELLTRCSEAGDIYKANYEGYYCVDCEEYKVASAAPPPIPPCSSVPRCRTPQPAAFLVMHAAASPHSPTHAVRDCQ